MRSVPLSALACAVCSLASFGCARGSTETLDTGRITFVDGGVDTGRIDAAGFDGGGFDAGFDGGTGFDGGGFDAGAPIDTGVDAPITMPDTGVDAPSCTPSTSQILINPNLDAAPLGTGWTQTAADPLYPPITNADIGIAWQSGSAGIAMGGLDDALDIVAQVVTIPVGTTRLTLRGYYAVGTDELGSTPYDVSGAFLSSTSGTLYETAVSLSNANAATAGSWTPFTYVFANPHAGESVRVSFESQTDSSYPTLFVFDTIALEATVTCP